MEMEFYMKNKKCIDLKMSDQVNVNKLIQKTNLPDRLFALYLISPEGDGDQWDKSKARAITHKDWTIENMTTEDRHLRSQYNVKFRSGSTEDEATNARVTGFISDTEEEHMLFFVITKK